MSTIKVNSIKNTATNDGGIAIDNSGHVQIDGQQFPSIGALSNRNIIDNPKMEVAQRGTSESGLADSPAFVADRWSYRRNGAWGTNSFTMSQETSGPPDGFSYYLRLAQSGTAAAVPTDTFCALNQRIEAINTILLNNGTTGTKEITVSWYARGSRPGKYCMALQAANSANSGNSWYVCEYTLTTSWQRFTHTIPAQNVETFGQISTINEYGMDLYFIAAADGDGNLGSGTAGSWHSAATRYTANQEQSFASTAGATFDLTGVQIELGGTATPFEHRSYGDELIRCQRYCFRYNGLDAGRPMIGIGQTHNSTQLRCPVKFAVPLRDTPTVTESGLEFVITSNILVSMYSVATDGALTGAGLFIQADSGTPFTAGQAGILRMEASTPSAFLQFDAEL